MRQRKKWHKAVAIIERSLIKNWREGNAPTKNHFPGGVSA